MRGFRLNEILIHLDSPLITLQEWGVFVVGNDTLAFNHSSVYLLLFGLVINIDDCLNIEDA